jgi:hypothetical protein
MEHRMRFRPSITDITVAIVLVAFAVLPDRTPGVKDAFAADDAQARLIAREQARVAAHPEDGGAAAALANALIDVGQTDAALRIAAEGAQRAGATSKWRALLAVSVAHAERVEVREAFDYATQALTACHTAQAIAETHCPSFEEVRVDIYGRQLDAGIRAGIDPRVDPVAFRAAAEAALRTVNVKDLVGGGAGSTP